MKRTILLIAGALIIFVAVVSVQTVFCMSQVFNGQQGDQNQQRMNHQGRDMELYYTIQTAVSSVNIVLSFLLIVLYANVYRRLRSQFSLALILFSMVLLSYAVSSNPLFHSLFGFGGFGLGPFAMLPDVFACIALIILIYVSLK